MSPETSEIICITCPMGCALQVTHAGETVISVDGQSCERGTEYAQAELADPRRMVTTTVRVRDGVHPLVPVYTSAPIPKPLVLELLAALREVELGAPVRVGQVVMKDALGTGIGVLASRDLDAAQ